AYAGVYITDSCKIHVIFDTREDRFSSLEDRKVTQSNCSDIQFKDSKMIISNCNDLNTFEFPTKENDLQTRYSQQWITKITLIGISLGGISAEIVIVLKLWR
ncbi:MAG: hypothetical protein GWN01_09075, partial [Nitrosopumilaceae archaeon]|nr:hypothetical protein [Nitrosopumilaceae archaeon]NIU87494.1 hypothetical protein [Nitrosopumilaceae archaeon]NIV65969.1 hypothetical protein [Nitrosopumilaceae archaeon]NIX61660.1 hypothetical protein [Nitrosopumilaceae archaeon]